MKKFISTISILCISAVFMSFESSAAIRTESFDVSDFTGINASGGYDIELVKSDVFSVIVSADEDIMPYVDIKCVKGILTIEMRKLPVKFALTRRIDPKVTVSMPLLNGIILSGACELKSYDTFDTSGMTRFSLSASGASEIDNLGINAAEVVVTVSGASDVELRGTASDLDIRASGASDFDGEDLKAENVKVSASGASEVEVYVGKRLSASVSGASSCVYTGNNQIQIDDMKVSGASSLKRK